MINFRKDFTFYVSIILVVLLLLSATTKNAIFLYLLFGASLLLINNPVYLLPVYIIASLSGNFFDIGGGFSISRIVALVFIIGSGFKYGGSFNVNKNYINPILLIFFFNIISSVTSLTGSMWGFLEMLPNLLIVFICSGIKFPHINKLTFILTI
ncbi:MAG: hypothetical protein KJ754_16260, partial [Bacteroidetes bacterium]|nr:hypothetical protein [Bacteroidota bacterium]MBU1580985.1 hypothetical protein [Bacteroidota bacterium]